MDPKLFDLLSVLVVAYYKRESIAIEVQQIDSILKKIREVAPVTTSEKALKVLGYVQRHKRPVTSAAVGEYFHLNQSTVAEHLRKLCVAGLVTKERIGSKTYWALKGKGFLPVEFDDVPVPVKPKATWPQPAMPKTSYPHARGYDD